MLTSRNPLPAELARKSPTPRTFVGNFARNFVGNFVSNFVGTPCRNPTKAGQFDKVSDKVSDKGAKKGLCKRIGFPVSEFLPHVETSDFGLRTSDLSCLLLAVSFLLSAAPLALAQEEVLELSSRYARNGEETLKAFGKVAQGVRQSIVKLNVDGETVALAAVIDRVGFAITKASELKPGKLTAWLASEQEVEADLIVRDDEHDVALVKVNGRGLKPIVWDDTPTSIGQWAITPGIIETPHAVGIVSTAPRRIRHPRAYIGIQFNRGGTDPIINEVLPGLGAEQAGLKPGDRILAVNDSAVTNLNQVIDLLREFREGQKPKLRLRRDDTEFDVEIPMKVPTPGQLGLGSSPDRAARMNGAISTRTEGFESVIQHDTALLPWLCGGPLVNLDGKGIGLNIARAGRVATYALPVPVLKRVIADLTSRIPTSAPPNRGS